VSFRSQKAAVLAPYNLLIVQPKDLQENARDTPLTSLQYIPELYNLILITVRLYIKAEFCQVTIGLSMLDSH